MNRFTREIPNLFLHFSENYSLWLLVHTCPPTLSYFFLRFMRVPTSSLLFHIFVILYSYLFLLCPRNFLELSPHVPIFSYDFPTCSYVFPTCSYDFPTVFIFSYLFLYFPICPTCSLPFPAFSLPVPTFSILCHTCSYIFLLFHIFSQPFPTVSLNSHYVFNTFSHLSLYCTTCGLTG